MRKLSVPAVEILLNGEILAQLLPVTPLILDVSAAEKMVHRFIFIFLFKKQTANFAIPGLRRHNLYDNANNLSGGF